MSYRDDLPQLGDALLLTDGGLETTLIFDDGFSLDDFASFPLLRDEKGRAALDRYFDSYLAIAARDAVGIVLETPTWRANPDWGARLGYSAADLAAIDQDAVALLVDARSRSAGSVDTLVISGNLGPRGDGYQPSALMTADEARSYHAAQIEAFAATAADMICALTLNYPDEAIGIVLAAADAGMPVAISFTVETEGQLPSSGSLASAIEAVDAATDGYASYFMVNCAHPTHFDDVLDAGAPWTTRIRGIRANASQLSHAELDEAEDLDSGDPATLGQELAGLRSTYPHLSVLGGCCGTDARHIDAISRACIG